MSTEGVIFFGLIAACIGLLIWAGNSEANQKEAFMTECLKDHKQYECTAMWRAGDNKSSTVVVPMYVGR